MKASRFTTWMACVALIAALPAAAQVGQYVEDFSTTDYMDSDATLALWGGGVLELHAHDISLRGNAVLTGSAEDVVLHGSYVLVAESLPGLVGGLKVVDASDPDALTVADSLITDMAAYGVDVAGNYAYLAGEGTHGFLSVDITAPDTLGSSYSCFGVPTATADVVVAGNRAYISALTSGLVVVDITYPDNMSHVVTYTTGGEAHGAAVSGNYVYVANGSAGLAVVDITNPDDPGPLYGAASAGNAWGIAVDGDYAYVADLTGNLRVFDISDPINPFAVGTLNLQGAATDVVLAGDYAYVAVAEYGVEVVDISNPESLQSLDYYSQQATVGKGIAVAGDRAFLAAGAGGLIRLDIADPVTPPIPVAQLDIDGNPGRVEVSGDYAYLPDGAGGDLHIVNIRDPRNPGPVISVNTPGEAMDIAIEGDIAYVADYNPSITVMDISNPSVPKLSGNIWLDGDATDVVVYDGFAYVSVASPIWPEHNGFKKISISDPAHPEWINLDCDYMSGLGRHARGLAVQDDRVYVADDLAGLRIVDLTVGCDPSRVTQGIYDTDGEAHAVDVVGDLAYVADGSNGLVIVSVANYAEPDSVGHFDTPGIARDVVIEGALAFVADDFAGMTILNISDPSAPVFLGRYETEGVTLGLDIDIVNSIAYLASHDEGLEIVRFNDPANPTRVGRYDEAYWWPTITDPDWYPNGNAYVDVEVHGDFAYVTDENSGLCVVDVSNPESPQPSLAGSLWSDLWACRTPGPARAVAIVDSYALVADGEYGLQVIDISDHERPRLIGALDGQGVSHGVAVSGNQLYFTDQGSVFSPSGMISVDVSDPLLPSLLGWNPMHNWPLCDDDPDVDCFYAARVGDLVVDGDHAFLSDHYRHLTTTSIADPADPGQLYETDTSTQVARDVDVAGDYAYVASHTYGLGIVYVKNPEAPVRKGGASTTAMDVDLAGTYAFVAGKEHGLLPVDVSVPTAPVSLPGYGTPNAWGVAVSGDYAYVADYDTGFWVFSVFAHGVVPGDNIAQSVALNDPDTRVARAALEAAFDDSIKWEFNFTSEDTSWAWAEVQPGTLGIAFAPMEGLVNDHLRWRATLYPADAGIAPSCSDLSVGWWYDAPVIDTVVDIPDDDGGWTRLEFTRSGYDFADDSSPVADYAVWRRVDNPALRELVLSADVATDVRGKRTESIMQSEIPDLGPGYEQKHVDGRTYIVAEGGRSGRFPRDTVWEYVAEVSAMQQEHYTAAVPTEEEDENPHPNIFLEFDNASNRIDPAPWAPFTATVYVENLDEGEGVSAIEFTLNRSFNGSLQSYTPLLPSPFEIGNPDIGWAIAGQCALPDTSGRVAVGSVTYLCDGVTPWTVEIEPNLMNGSRLVSDCQYDVESWTVRESPTGHGGVLMPPPPGEYRPLYEVYRVSAHRSDPTLWYVSEPDSGYSVDDQAPAPVRGLEIPDRLVLSWTECEEPDVDHYVVYVTDDEELVEGAGQVLETEETSCELPESTVGRYVYVTAVDLSGNESEPSELMWNSGTAIPDRKFLAQNVPNPFNPVTTIRFGLPAEADVSIEVYDVAGRLVTVLAEGPHQPGEHEVLWSGRDGAGHSVAAGVYFYSMTSGEFEARRKMILLK